ncbi:flavin reductase family protein [Actinoplanes teichomyceticus]|uniref:Flavin reductase (DIM6/NTAB) family NADH-FMN oxidoreductase RutF n=1 Tax=Actinoplanes teichomyceticus TaxID=1867 RepID=A0A561WBT3_ACTTI|nr:flavin reductase family protein [Actinoplanes teichomyceticus]TWG21330.1 flavin reductase (DIM6/NTAB) family NADH-FMN oxidoreductase RutF [Actinoplanes teichomyceticus]GIF16415.1 oxidoreductase [Actinoplanes teichomyceticus]
MDGQLRTASADLRALRRTFAAFATGVTVLTVGGSRPHGMTANSFTSVSLDPPLVLVCVDRTAVMHQRVLDAGSFAVSVLAAGQHQVARHFADRRRPLGLAEFDGIACEAGPATGAPLIGGALAGFECVLRHMYDGGDHSIVVGELLSMRRADGDDPLLFLDGRFRQVLAAEVTR